MGEGVIRPGAQAGNPWNTRARVYANPSCPSARRLRFAGRRPHMRNRLPIWGPGDGRSYGVPQTVLVQPVQERLIRHAEEARGLSPIPTGLLQGLTQHFTLMLVPREAAARKAKA